MGLVDDFEKRLERVVEGAFARAFRSKVQPSEIGRRMLREMEGGKEVSVGAVYVPNAYTVLLSPADHERFAGLADTLRKEFIDLLKTNAKERRWRLPGPLSVAFAPDGSRKEGTFAVAARHEASEEEAGPTEKPPALLKIEGPGAQEWALHQDRLTIGRSSTNDIMLPDANASREHAALAKREDGWWIVDLGSTNGTLVNDALVKERRLHDGDVVKVGATELHFIEQEEA